MSRVIIFNALVYLFHACLFDKGQLVRMRSNTKLLGVIETDDISQDKCMVKLDVIGDVVFADEAELIPVSTIFIMGYNDNSFFEKLSLYREFMKRNRDSKIGLSMDDITAQRQKSKKVFPKNIFGYQNKNAKLLSTIGKRENYYEVVLECDEDILRKAYDNLPFFNKGKAFKEKRFKQLLHVRQIYRDSQDDRFRELIHQKGYVNEDHQSYKNDVHQLLYKEMSLLNWDQIHWIWLRNEIFKCMAVELRSKILNNGLNESARFSFIARETLHETGILKLNENGLYNIRILKSLMAADNIVKEYDISGDKTDNLYVFADEDDTVVLQKIIQEKLMMHGLKNDESIKCVELSNSDVMSKYRNNICCNIAIQAYSQLN